MYERKGTLFEDGELDVGRGQHCVEGADRHLAGPVTLIFGVHARQSEGTISAKVAVAREFLNNHLWVVPVERLPGPRTFLHAAARYAFQRGLAADRRGSVRRRFNETDFGWNSRAAQIDRLKTPTGQTNSRERSCVAC